MVSSSRSPSRDRRRMSSASIWIALVTEKESASPVTPIMRPSVSPPMMFKTTPTMLTFTGVTVSCNA